MYTVTVNGFPLRANLEAEDAIYWVRRVGKLFPKAIVSIVRVTLRTELTR